MKKNKASKANKEQSKFSIWYNSDAGKRTVGAVYSIGAAVVIVGALFKLMHWPMAGVLLTIGMFTEAILFTIGVFEKPHKEYEWDRAVLGFGVNDFNTSRPLGAYLEDMKGALLPLLSRKEAEVFLLGPIPWAGRTEPNDLGLHLDDYCEALRNLASEFPEVRFIDGRTLLPDDPAYYVDGIHPNDSGSELLFRNLKRLFAV